MTDSQHNLSHLRVLVVDDHLLMRSIITQNLRNLGFEDIEMATNGQDALRILREAVQAGTPYNILFLDWHMPVEDGISVLKTCRADRSMDKMAIIMLTAEQEKKNVLQAIENGATSYIIKPVSMESLEKNMRNVLLWLEKKGVTAGMAEAVPAQKKQEILSNELKTELKPVISRGLEKIFSNLFNVKIIPEDFNGPALNGSMVCVGRLFQDDITINLRFFFEQSLLRPLLMQLYAPQFIADEKVYADAACEIVNILASQVKAFLNNHGYQLSLDFPEMTENGHKNNESAVIDVLFSLNSESYFLVDVSANTQSAK